tara:strand:+ start:187 stop:417 length:231 start_codon:yes stop_codon:yes gene_type:complete
MNLVFTVIETDCLGNEAEFEVFTSIGSGFDIVEADTGSTLEFNLEMDEVEYFFDQEKGCTQQWQPTAFASSMKFKT